MSSFISSLNKCSSGEDLEKCLNVCLESAKSKASELHDPETRVIVKIKVQEMLDSLSFTLNAKQRRKTKRFVEYLDQYVDATSQNGGDISPVQKGDYKLEVVRNGNTSNKWIPNTDVDISSVDDAIHILRATTSHQEFERIFNKLIIPDETESKLKLKLLLEEILVSKTLSLNKNLRRRISRMIYALSNEDERKKIQSLKNTQNQNTSNNTTKLGNNNSNKNNNNNNRTMSLSTRTTQITSNKHIINLLLPLTNQIKQAVSPEDLDKSLSGISLQDVTINTLQENQLLDDLIDHLTTYQNNEKNNLNAKCRRKIKRFLEGCCQLQLSYSKNIILDTKITQGNELVGLPGNSSPKTNSTLTAVTSTVSAVTNSNRQNIQSVDQQHHKQQQKQQQQQQQGRGKAGEIHGQGHIGGLSGGVAVDFRAICETVASQLTIANTVDDIDSVLMNIHNHLLPVLSDGDASVAPGVVASSREGLVRVVDRLQGILNGGHEEMVNAKIRRKGKRLLPLLLAAIGHGGSSPGVGTGGVTPGDGVITGGNSTTENKDHILHSDIELVPNVASAPLEEVTEVVNALISLLAQPTVGTKEGVMMLGPEAVTQSSSYTGVVTKACDLVGKVAGSAHPGGSCKTRRLLRRSLERLLPLLCQGADRIPPPLADIDMEEGLLEGLQTTARHAVDLLDPKNFPTDQPLPVTVAAVPSTNKSPDQIEGQRVKRKKSDSQSVTQIEGMTGDSFPANNNENSNGNSTKRTKFNNSGKSLSSSSSSIPYVLFIGQLDYGTTEEAIREHFLSNGVVPDVDRITVRLQRDLTTGRSKGMAFVEFKEPGEMYRGLKLDKSVLDGRVINVEKSVGGRNKDLRKVKIADLKRKYSSSSTNNDNIIENDEVDVEERDSFEDGAVVAGGILD